VRTVQPLFFRERGGGPKLPRGGMLLELGRSYTMPPRGWVEAGQGLLVVLLLLAPVRCGGNLPAAACTASPPASPPIERRVPASTPAPSRTTRPGPAATSGDARAAQQELALREDALAVHRAPVCSDCAGLATIGLARDVDGLWVRFLCEACHGPANMSCYAGEHGGSSAGLHALGLGGRCSQCRTKASYGAACSPPQRCLRHKQAGDIARSLGSSCVVEGCKKARLFGSRGGVALFCAAHRRSDDVDVKNKRCQFQDCIRQASYGDARTRSKIACAEHRQAWHVDLKHERRRCAAPEGCRKLGVFKRRLVTPPDSPSRPEPTPSTSFGVGHSSEDGGDSSSSSQSRNRRRSGAAQVSADEAGAWGSGSKSGAWGSGSMSHSKAAPPGCQRNAQAADPADSCSKSGQHGKSEGEDCKHDECVFVCASHLNLNVFSASAPHEVGPVPRAVVDAVDHAVISAAPPALSLAYTIAY